MRHVDVFGNDTPDLDDGDDDLSTESRHDDEILSSPSASSSSSSASKKTLPRVSAMAVISLSQRLALVSASPAEMSEQQISSGMLPFPTEEVQMRASALHQSSQRTFSSFLRSFDFLYQVYVCLDFGVANRDSGFGRSTVSNGSSAASGCCTSSFCPSNFSVCGQVCSQTNKSQFL